MSLGVGIQSLGNIVKLMRQKVKGEIICVFGTSYHSKKETNYTENAAEYGTFKLVRSN